MQLTEYETNSLNKLSKVIEEGKFSNYGLIQLIELCGRYLNLKTIPEYAKEHNKSYNGVKKFRNIMKIFNVKFVIDNN